MNKLALVNIFVMTKKFLFAKFDCTQCDHFLETKADIGEKIIDFLEELKTRKKKSEIFLTFKLLQNSSILLTE